MLLGDRHEIDVLVERYEDVVARIARRHRVPRRRARLWFGELVRFLDLCAESPSTLAPSKPVDKAWHEFLLFTREYDAFCQGRYGRFLHRDPHDRPDRDAYVRTYLDYTDRYGRPPRRVWPNPLVPTDGGGHGTGCGAGAGDGGGGCGGGGCGGGGA